MNKLIVLNQKISEWEKKGEIHCNYFNPQKKYNLIIILSFVKGGKPSISSLKKMCGKSKFVYYTIENKFIPFFYL